MKFIYYPNIGLTKIETENPNAPDDFGVTPIYNAAGWGHSEIVKILAPLTDNPNAASNNGYTPIHRAAENGHTEIVKILAPLTDKPNAPNNAGKTPSEVAANTEIKNLILKYSSGKCTEKPSSKK